MGIALIKKINEKTPYWVKRPFAKMIRGKLIHNAVFLDEYEALDRFDDLSTEEQEKLQLETLKGILQHAYEHTQYYKQLFDEIGLHPMDINSVEDLQCVPVLTKALLTTNFESLQADDVSDAYLVTTGGTTGEPTRIQMAKDSIYKEWAFVYHYWSRYGYDFRSSKLATFRGVDLNGKISEINPLYGEIRMNPFLLSETNIEVYIDRIEKYGADFIYGYPSAVYNFCRIAKKKGICLRGRFKAAFLISENLYPFQEELIKQYLQCDIAIFYGHSERAVFAERGQSGYIFNKLYGVTEINSKGEPVVTGFINRKMPLIRYVVDDRVESIKDGGYHIIGHRDCDVLLGCNGEQISMAAINFHDDTFEGIEKYQFFQDEAGRCVLRIVSDQPVSEKTKEKIRNRVESKLGSGFACKVCQVADVALTSRGKYKMLIQNLNILDF